MCLRLSPTCPLCVKREAEPAHCAFSILLMALCLKLGAEPAHYANSILTAHCTLNEVQNQPTVLILFYIPLCMTRGVEPGSVSPLY